jgi:hypothetical protein
MVKEIRWTQESIDTFNKTIQYLQKEWTEKEVSNFIQASERVIGFIAEYPGMFRKTSKRNVHEALITPHNLLIYKVYSSQIALITFWDTRQHPRRKKH